MSEYVTHEEMAKCLGEIGLRVDELWRRIEALERQQGPASFRGDDPMMPTEREFKTKESNWETYYWGVCRHRDQLLRILSALCKLAEMPQSPSATATSWRRTWSDEWLLQWDRAEVELKRYNLWPPQNIDTKSMIKAEVKVPEYRDPEIRELVNKIDKLNSKLHG